MLVECILDNYWLWSFLLLAPVFMPLGLRSSGVATVCWLVATFAGYVLLNLAVDRSHDLLIADATARHASEEMTRLTEVDGAKYVFTMLFGWIPSAVYATVWLAIWQRIAANSTAPAAVGTRSAG